MKKVLFIIGMACFILTGCNNQENRDTGSPASNSDYDTSKPAGPENLPDSTGKVGFPKL